MNIPHVRILVLLALAALCAYVVNQFHGSRGDDKARDAQRIAQAFAPRTVEGPIVLSEYPSTAAAEEMKRRATLGRFRIRGVVRDETAGPVPNARLILIPHRAVWTRREDSVMARSNEDGEYVIESNSRGPFDLLCRHAAFRDESAIGIDAEPAPGTTHCFVLRAGGLLRGRVETPSGHAVINAKVVVRGRLANNVHRLDGHVPGAAVFLRVLRTDGNGEFEVRGLDDQLFIVQAQAPGISDLHPKGRDTACILPGSSVTLVLAPTSVIIAQAVDAASGALVRTARWRPVLSYPSVDRYLRPPRTVRMGDQLVNVSMRELGRHTLAKLLVCRSWPIPSDAHTIAMVKAPGYVSQEIRVPWQLGDAPIKPTIVRLFRDGTATGTVFVAARSADGRSYLGPYRGYALLKRRGQSNVDVHITLDKEGKGALGHVPVAKYRLFSSGFETRTYTVTGGERATWELVPRFGIVVVRPTLDGSEPGGLAVRFVPGHTDSVVAPDAPLPYGGGGTFLASFIRPVGMGFENERELAVPVLAGEWTVELFRPGYRPARVPVAVLAGVEQVIEPVLEPANDPRWPPWPVVQSK